MRNDYLEKKQLQELYAELKKVDNAEYYYQMNTLLKSSSLICFIGVFVMIVISAIVEMLVTSTNGLLVVLVVLAFALASIAFLWGANIYKNKTIKLLDNYYKSIEAK